MSQLIRKKGGEFLNLNKKCPKPPWCPVIFKDYYAPLNIWTEVRAFPKSDGGISLFYHDVSERKAIETGLLFE